MPRRSSARRPTAAGRRPTRASATATVPDDLRAALDANPAAAEFFEALDRANRYAILYRLHDAKRPATRAARIERFVAMLAAGERIHQ